MPKRYEQFKYIRVANIWRIYYTRSVEKSAKNLLNLKMCQIIMYNAQDVNYSSFVLDELVSTQKYKEF